MANCHEIYKKGKYMPLRMQAQNMMGFAGNEGQVEEHKAKKLGDTPYYGMLLVIGALLDQVATGGEGYVIIGMTRDGTSCSFTLNSAGGKDAVYAGSLADLGNAAEKWL